METEQNGKLFDNERVIILSTQNYNGYVIEIVGDIYIISNGNTRLSQSLFDAPHKAPAETPTLVDSAKAHINVLIAEGEQERQKQSTLEEVKSTVDYHDEVITDAILRGIL